ncbi:MAG: ASKHA domain-containing protein [Desulfobacter sp.]
MTAETHTIRILPHGREIRAPHGRTLMDILTGENLMLRSDCGGKGKCGKCRVEQVLDSGRRRDLFACVTQVTQNLEIEIPESTLFSTHTIGKAAVNFPDLFTERFKDADGPETYGIAVDLGTTTIAVYLCHMTKGEVVSSVSVKNPQALYGDDVMSRIGAIGQDAKNLERLQGLVTGAMAQGMEELLASEKLGRDTVSGMVVVGNPAMIHILTGVDPAPIGCSPYLPAFYDPRTIPARDLGFIPGDFDLHILPQVSGFIGGDILAAALAVDFEHQAPGTLLIDLGTNGELMLRSETGYFATSCATGPAFEGASLSCGMQAVPGAVTRVELAGPDARPEYTVIHKKKQPAKPSGLCGSGVVSAVAQFCRQGIILPDGAFNPDTGSPALVRDDAGRYRYDIVPGSAQEDQQPVYISQKDIRSVQLGKGALITGIDFLLKKAGFDRPEKIIIAGAFGTFLDQSDMKTLGMIPPRATHGIEMAGNAAGAGAVMALCDGEFRHKAEAMVRDIRVIDLASDQEFHASFIHRLSFPEQ